MKNTQAKAIIDAHLARRQDELPYVDMDSKDLIRRARQAPARVKQNCEGFQASALEQVSLAGVVRKKRAR